jgi:hypothetical protein
MDRPTILSKREKDIGDHNGISYMQSNDVRCKPALHHSNTPKEITILKDKWTDVDPRKQYIIDIIKEIQTIE